MVYLGPVGDDVNLCCGAWPSHRGDCPGQPGWSSVGNVRIELTPEAALALYRYLESEDGPEYWTTPLATVQRQLSDWHKYESPL